MTLTAASVTRRTGARFPDRPHNQQQFVVRIFEFGNRMALLVRDNFEIVRSQEPFQSSC